MEEPFSSAIERSSSARATARLVQVQETGVKREYPRVDHANRNFRRPRSLLAPPPIPHPARLTHFSCRSCFLGRPWVGRVVLHSLSTCCNSRESLSPSIPPESFVDASTLSRLRSPFHRRSYAVTFVNHFLHLSYSEGAPALQGQQPACHSFGFISKLSLTEPPTSTPTPPRTPHVRDRLNERRSHHRIQRKATPRLLSSVQHCHRGIARTAIGQYSGSRSVAWDSSERAESTARRSYYTNLAPLFIIARMKTDHTLSFRTAAIGMVLINLAHVVTASDGISQAYCSTQNTGSDYSPGKLLAFLRCTAFAKAEQPTAYTSPWAHAPTPAGRSTRSQCCRARIVGAPTTSRLNRTVLRTAAPPALASHPTFAATQVKGCMATSLLTVLHLGLLARRLPRHRAHL
jgi:hypothetical protein